MDTLSPLTTLLALPFARQVLSFEEPFPPACRAVYEGIYPYAPMNGEAWVRWALDSMERLLTMEHEDVLEEGAAVV